jgi:NADPH-dependent 2,4-dienoyl-CoA reductase/sulfur reductase-like enzyme
MHLVILGGSDAGISAGLRARELAPETEVTLVIADAFANYSICGLPFFLSGEVPDWKSLAHRTLGELESAGLRLLFNTTAERIEPGRHGLHVRHQDGLRELAYDRLIIGTGAEPICPPIPGINLPGVFPLHTMEDSFALDNHLKSKQCTTALVVGGGYIGLEMADALRTRGLEVTLVELAPTLLQTVDASLGELVRAELERRGVRVLTDTKVERFRANEARIVATGTPELELSADLVVVALGVTPASNLARDAGLELGARRAIRVSRRMETSVADIYAAGDCVETWHRVLNAPTYIPLGTTAHKQGRIAGENAVGGASDFAGTLGTQVVKVFDLVAARTGLRHDEAINAGFAPFTSEFTCWDHKVYYPHAHGMRIRVTGDQKTGALLGAQMVGHVHSEVGKRIDVFASALFHRSRVEDLEELDLSYTPPFSSPWDPVQMSAQQWVASVRAGP